MDDCLGSDGGVADDAGSYFVLFGSSQENKKFNMKSWLNKLGFCETTMTIPRQTGAGVH